MDIETIIQIIVTVFCSVIASSGLWAFIAKKSDHKDSKTKMLIGLGHDRILALGMEYIERGYITYDEHENLFKYLYSPYHELGGNGSADRIMKEIENIPIKKKD